MDMVTPVPASPRLYLEAISPPPPASRPCSLPQDPRVAWVLCYRIPLGAPQALFIYFEITGESADECWSPQSFMGTFPSDKSSPALSASQFLIHVSCTLLIPLTANCLNCMILWSSVKPLTKTCGIPHSYLHQPNLQTHQITKSDVYGKAWFQ